QHGACAVGDAGGERVPARDGYSLSADADEGAADAAMPDQLADDEADGIARDGEADALRARNHCGVDADDVAARGSERAAGAAGVEGGIGLDDVLDHPTGPGWDRPAERGDDSGGDGRLEAERIADRDDQLTALQALRIAESRRRQVTRRIGPDEGEI